MYNACMVNNKSTFYIGVFVFLIPFLGFPTTWKMALVVLSGVVLVLISIRIPIPKRIVRNYLKKERSDIHTNVSNPKIETTLELKPTVPEISPSPVIDAQPSIIPTLTTSPSRRTNRHAKVDSVRKPKIKEL